MSKRYLVSVMLARMEEAMMPKKRYLETGEAVKPEASMLIGKWNVIGGSISHYDT